MAKSIVTDDIPSEIKLKPYEGDLSMDCKFFLDTHMLLTRGLYNFLNKKLTHPEIFGLMFSQFFENISTNIRVMTLLWVLGNRKLIVDVEKYHICHI